jgi:cytochrome c6
VAILFACSAALVSAAGCGGSESSDRLTKEEYLQEFQAIGNDLEGSFDELINADVDPTDFEAIAGQADRLGEGLDEIGDRVDELTPPEEVQAAHDKLIDGLREFADWAHELADTVRTAPAAELVDVLEEYGLTGEFDPEKVPGAAKIQEAVEEFEDAGYTLGDTETGTATETVPVPPDADAAAGKVVFLGAGGCGACHTLADAGTSGSVGPDLDASRPSYGLAVDRVTNGQGIMPPLAGQLTEDQIRDVAAYVSSVASG